MCSNAFILFILRQLFYLRARLRLCNARAVSRTRGKCIFLDEMNTVKAKTNPISTYNSCFLSELINNELKAFAITSYF